MELATRFDTLPGGAVLVTNAERGIWDSSSAWRLEEELRIGNADGDGPDALSDVRDLALDGAGNVYVLQAMTKTIHVFDTAGRFVRAIGRPGKGPGEFGFPNGMVFDPAGHLWVADPDNARYLAFDTLGNVVRTQQRRISGYRVTWLGTVDNEARLLESLRIREGTNRYDAFVRFDTSFTRADTLLRSRVDDDAVLASMFVFRRGNGDTEFVGVPFVPEEVTLLDPRGFVWTARTGEYRIVQLGTAGDTVRVITRAAAPRAVTSAERAAAIARLDSVAAGAPYDASRIPHTHPVLDWLAVAPDGTLWVALTAPDGAAERRLDVFDAEGRYLGAVRAPRTLQPPARITRDAIHAVVTDELDVPTVVRLRIVRPRGA